TGKWRLWIFFEELEPGADSSVLEGLQERPGGGLQYEIGKKSVPRGVELQSSVLFQSQSPRELSLHCGKRTLDCFPRPLDLLNRMGRFELDPIDTSFRFIETKPLQRFRHAPVQSVPSITLGHDHKIGIDLVFCVHRRAVPRDGFLTGNDGNAGRQRAPLLLQRLVVEAQTREACYNRLPSQAANGHADDVACIAVE